MKIFRSLLDWVWRMAETEGAMKVLFVVSLTESIFFPIPPDLLLIPMALAQQKKAFRLAAICLAASVIGGVIGYLIGAFFMDSVGMSIVRFYGLTEQYVTVQGWYEAYNAWVVAVAGLTPIPYKLCTLSAGAFHVNFEVFLIASIASRGLRFFVVAGLIYLFGHKIRHFLEKRLELLFIGGMILVVVGFAAVHYLE